jgi:hypothetical protein
MIESTTPTTLTAPGVKLAAVITEPRLTFTSLYRCVVQTVSQLQIPFLTYTSAFWAKGIECAIEDLIRDQNPEYILCLDFDTVFTPNDVQRLVQHMDENPDLAAIWPVQMSRHEDKPLCFDTSKDYTTTLTRATFGHFGCTIIRRSVLDKMPHPWFMDLPNPHTGRWNEEPKSDADITFWRSMKYHKHPVAQANDVVVGHVELAVRWPHKTGLMLQPIQAYQVYGQPTESQFDPACWQPLPEPSYSTEPLNGSPTDSSEPQSNSTPSLGGDVREPQPVCP